MKGNAFTLRLQNNQLGRQVEVERMFAPAFAFARPPAVSLAARRANRNRRIYS